MQFLPMFLDRGFGIRFLVASFGHDFYAVTNYGSQRPCVKDHVVYKTKFLLKPQHGARGSLLDESQNARELKYNSANVALLLKSIQFLSMFLNHTSPILSGRLQNVPVG